MTSSYRRAHRALKSVCMGTVEEDVRNYSTASLLWLLTDSVLTLNSVAGTPQSKRRWVTPGKLAVAHKSARMQAGATPIFKKVSDQDATLGSAVGRSAESIRAMRRGLVGTFEGLVVAEARKLAEDSENRRGKSPWHNVSRLTGQVVKVRGGSSCVALDCEVTVQARAALAKSSGAL